MLQNKETLIYVTAERNKGYSEKKQKEYDFATIEVSDGIGSIPMPLDPQIHTQIVQSFKRGDKIGITVDARKNIFGRTEFIVSHVQKSS